MRRRTKARDAVDARRTTSVFSGHSREVGGDSRDRTRNTLRSTCEWGYFTCFWHSRDCVVFVSTQHGRMLDYTSTSTLWALREASCEGITLSLRFIDSRDSLMVPYHSNAQVDLVARALLYPWSRTALNRPPSPRERR